MLDSGDLTEASISAAVDAATGQQANLKVSRPTGDPALQLLHRFGFVEVSRDGERVVLSRRLPGVGRKAPDGELRKRTRHSAYLWNRDADGVLLCRLSEAPLNAGWWTLPGGGLEPGESVADGVVREVEEETGLSSAPGAELAHTSFTLRWIADDGVAEEYTVDQLVLDGSVGDGLLRHEIDGSTNHAARLQPSDFWNLSLVPVAVSGAQAGLRSNESRPPSPLEIVSLHAAAVTTRRHELMVADYSPDAVLERGSEVYSGGDAIHAYFSTIGSRLGSGHVHFDRPEPASGGDIALPWRIYGGLGHGASGVDSFTVRDGFITRQTVHLASADF
jgi:8-oxo-dGTP diphosphatase